MRPASGIPAKKEQKYFSLWIRTIDLGVDLPGIEPGIMGPARYHCAKLNAGLAAYADATRRHTGRVD